MAKAMVEQLGLVTMNPSHPLFLRCNSTNSKCSGLTSGITNGTSGSIRMAAALDATTIPASANWGSTILAMSAGNAENTMSTSLTSLGSVSTTVMFRAISGILQSKYQVTASSYFFPADLFEAVRVVNSKSG